MCEDFFVTFAPSQRNKRFHKAVFAALLVLIAGSLLYAALHRGEWKVPEEAKARTNPLQPSAGALEAIRPVFHDKCAECHGETGRGNGPQAKTYYTQPADFTDAARLRGETDGELFYKISHGRRPMPSYRKKLTEEQRWQLVLLIRSFAAQAASAPVAQPAEQHPVAK